MSQLGHEDFAAPVSLDGTEVARGRDDITRSMVTILICAAPGKIVSDLAFQSQLTIAREAHLDHIPPAPPPPPSPPPQEIISPISTEITHRHWTFFFYFEATTCLRRPRNQSKAVAGKNKASSIFAHPACDLMRKTNAEGLRKKCRFFSNGFFQSRLTPLVSATLAICSKGYLFEQTRSRGCHSQAPSFPLSPASLRLFSPLPGTTAALSWICFSCLGQLLFFWFELSWAQSPHTAFSCPSRLLELLGWPTLAWRRRRSKLLLFWHLVQRRAWSSSSLL